MTEDRRQVFVMSADGGAPVQVTNNLDDEQSPEWSPDGGRLLLPGRGGRLYFTLGDLQSDIWVADVEGPKS